MMIQQDILLKIKKEFSSKPLVVEGANGSLGLSLLHVLSELRIEIPHLILTTFNSIPLSTWNNVAQNITFLKASDENFIDKRNSIIDSLKIKFNVFFGSGYGRPNMFLSKPLDIINANIKSLLNYTEYDQVNLFAYMSTSEIYSGLQCNATESTPIVSSTQQKRSIYIESKRLGEAITSNLVGNNSTRAVSYRIALATPPVMIDNDNRVLADLINSGLKKKKVVLNGGSNLIRQYQYGPNAIYKILGSLINGKATLYNNAGTHVVTLGELAMIIAKILKVDHEIKMHNADITAPKSVLIDTNLIDCESGYIHSNEKSFEFYLRKLIP